ncbi:MAG TPA: ANTAR domain-containing protein [Sporichthya sp.]|nr:ANTAR domain-containing protein [Sporichthya sp.]
MNANDRRPGTAQLGGDRTASDDSRLQRVNERLELVARSLKELDQRREAARQANETARSREAARTAIDLAHARLAEVQGELEGLRTAMRNRGVIEQAKGMLMVRLQVDEDKAFDYLRTMSNTTNRKLSDVAADVVRTRAGETGFR